MLLQSHEALLVQGGLGRFHRITAIFTDTNAANAYLAAAPEEAVIAASAALILIARIDDLGILLPSPPLPKL